MEHYTHLGPFSDIIAAAQRQGPLFPIAAPGPATQQRIRAMLGFCDGDETPRAVQTDARWEHDGLRGEAISWSAGFGPRTAAWLLKPADAPEPLPGILALHDHGGFKFYGKEKIAAGPDAPPLVLQDYHAHYYGGRAYANALAREGFAVLIHDTFLWGSRRFPLETMPPSIQQLAGGADEIAQYNAAASHHEHLVEKYCALLGTTMAGVVSREDRIALNYLCSRADVDAAQVGCLGLSGGGNRAALLLATHARVAAAVIIGLMSTYAALLDHNVANHTWMLFPHGWARHGDWPDIAACRAPLPLLVQYALDDDLFTPAGMQAAHARLAAHYARVGHADAYSGQFYPGPHQFDLTMQQAAFDWLKQQLIGNSGTSVR